MFMGLTMPKYWLNVLMGKDRKLSFLRCFGNTYDINKLFDGVNILPSSEGAKLNDFLSSCTDLLDSASIRVSIIMQFLTSGGLNMAAGFIHFHQKEQDFINLIHLSIADGLMSVYLGLIMVVDLSYIGSFNKLIIHWQQHILCQIAAIINYTSCQASLLLLVVLSVTRAKAIASMVKLQRNDKTLMIKCAVAWISVIMISFIIFVFYQSQIAEIHNP